MFGKAIRFTQDANARIRAKAQMVISSELFPIIELNPRQRIGWAISLVYVLWDYGNFLSLSRFACGYYIL